MKVSDKIKKEIVSFCILKDFFFSCARKVTLQGKQQARSPRDKRHPPISPLLPKPASMRLLVVVRAPGSTTRGPYFLLTLLILGRQATTMWHTRKQPRWLPHAAVRTRQCCCYHGGGLKQPASLLSPLLPGAAHLTCASDPTLLRQHECHG